MTAKTLRAITALLALTLLVAGCSLGRSLAPTHSPREEETRADLGKQVKALRSENAQLRKQQAALQASLQDLQHSVAQATDEQRQYRETMTKNFDLLEQSVSLTLSRTITANLGQGPAHKNPVRNAPGSAAQAPAPAPQSGPKEARSAHAAKRPLADAQGGHHATSRASGHAVREVLTASGDPAVMTGHPDAAQATPVALVSGPHPARSLALDPDLAEPSHPRTLTAHPEAQPLYEKGFALFARKDYSQAILVFRNFLQRFPDDVYSDNAQFWIGECYLNEHRPAEAQAAYRAVLRDYAHGSTLQGYKAPDAMYRLGQLYERNGQQQHARQFFSLLARRFPDTSPGRKAQRELDRLSENTAAR